MEEQLLITLISLFFFPVVSVLLLVIILASLGKSLGIRKRYVQFLLRVFEFGRVKIAHYKSTQAEEEEEKLDDEVIVDNSSVNENGQTNLIKRDITLSATQGFIIPDSYIPSVDEIKKEFHLADTMYFAKCGMEAIIEDEVTKRFSAEELNSWNLLSRSNISGYHFISFRLTFLWCVGFLVRYFVLFPFRLIIAVLGVGWLIICTAFIGYLPEGRSKRALNEYVMLMCFRILARACSAIITFHDEGNRSRNGICVANHTSPIDVIIMSVDNCYAMIGQSQGGLLGILQRAMARATAHIWFERSEAKDRNLVVNRLREHVQDKDKLPILIFPEGTCINNTSVMMFKKGSFEVGTTIYPVAIKYDPRFGDAFWNSSKQGMVAHLISIMTSWALVCDVWYLPPMSRKENELAVDFANRVKSEIASKGGLVDLEWDGQLKRVRAKASWREKQQENYSKLLKVE
ncbi:glycerol-3-phosphate acyltransferase 4-like [Haliotis rubra]|uniref:glycerol-3-phosphate acyltransferase 4-like n=1 Tax=Haliotis rubra TaxID=36100 RepID=UPI001EE5D665|nr:glycerol-3-phosphate acyltransferase 4-like [Haliotis rubra]